MSPRRAYPKISKQADGSWHSWVTVSHDDEPLDRRHVKRSTYEDAKAKVDDLLEQKRANAVVRPGRGVTVEQWLESYLDAVAPRRCTPDTIYDYRSKCRLYVYPKYGKLPVDRLEPHHLDEIYLAMARSGLAGTTQLKVHRILTRALEIALRRRLVRRNVAKLMDSPSIRKVEQRPLTLQEAQRVLEAAAGRGRNFARWAIALSLGLRQGEALGLRWPYLHLDTQELRVWWQLRRRSFEHGCQPVGSCGHKRGGNCPQRWLSLRDGEFLLEGGLLLKEPKGTSKRTVHSFSELDPLWRRQRTKQVIEKALAGDAYHDYGLVFCEPDGRPIAPDRDYAEWKSICAEAEVQEARLHDARHTAGTIMLALGSDLATVQEVLGHSDVRTTRGYVHVASEMARAATQRIGTSLFGGPTQAEVLPSVHP